jgi:hypothetical protein
MSKKINQHASTIINQDEINKAGDRCPPPIVHNKPIKPLSLAYWLGRANKIICLKSKLSIFTKPRRIATLG